MTSPSGVKIKVVSAIPSFIWEKASDPAGRRAMVLALVDGAIPRLEEAGALLETLEVHLEAKFGGMAVTIEMVVPEP